MFSFCGLHLSEETCGRCGGSPTRNLDCSSLKGVSNVFLQSIPASSDSAETSAATYANSVSKSTTLVFQYKYDIALVGPTRQATPFTSAKQPCRINWTRRTKRLRVLTRSTVVYIRLASCKTVGVISGRVQYAARIPSVSSPIYACRHHHPHSDLLDASRASFLFDGLV